MYTDEIFLYWLTSYDPAPDPDDMITNAWDFGDSISSTEMIPAAHTYTEPDNYVIALTITGDQGSFHINQLDITVRKSGGKK